MRPPGVVRLVAGGRIEEDFVAVFGEDRAVMAGWPPGVDGFGKRKKKSTQAWGIWQVAIFFQEPGGVSGRAATDV